jgi:alkylation response protein AidB-like acyl-CoA dehydrogenase
MNEFSLDLGDDLREMREWVHGFAESVVRPAGAEWDEREETPWPVLEEAAKIGLYSLDFFAQQAFEPSGLGIAVA